MLIGAVDEAFVDFREYHDDLVFLLVWYRVIEDDLLIKL